MQGFLKTVLIGAAALLSVSAAFTDGPACNMNHAAAGVGTVAANTGDAVAAAPAAETKSAYPLDVCIVTGEKLGAMGDPVVKTYEGREVQFCCAGCIKDFEKNKAKYMKKLDEAMILKLKPSYSVTTCVVSGEKLGEMGAPVDYVYHNQLVRFCCSGCIKDFEKDPAKYLSKLTAATAPAIETAPTPESK